MKVVKALVPAADPGKFDLQVNADTKKTDAGDTDTTGFVNVAVGSNPTVGELAGTGTDLADYESSIACAGDSSASGSGTSLAVGALTAGQQATCTITNKRKPQVKVVKALVPAADPGKFNLQVNAVTKKTDAGDTDNTGFVNVAVGSNPTVGELAGTGTDLTDYESSIACAGDASASGSGTSLAVGALTAGQQATCTITNKRKPQVKVVKALVPAADPGKFNLQVNAVTKKTDAGDTDNTGFVNVAVGSNPTVGELAGTGTDLTDYESSIACAGDSSASGSGTSLAVGALTAGQQATCTITNKRKPQVKVVKALVPAADPGKFNLQVNAVTKKTDAGDTDNTGFVNVAVGSNPTVGELAGTGTDLTDYESSIACAGDSSASGSGTSLAVGALTAGQQATCTITNKRKPQVKVVKALVPAADPGKFNLQVNAVTKKTDAGDTDNTGFVNVAVGSNPTVGELAGTGTDLTDYESSIACAGDSSASGSGTSLAVGALTAGQQATCTITNKRKPQVKVVKALVPAADPGKFNLQVNAVTKKTDAGDTDNTGFVNVAVGSNPTVGELAGTGTDLTDYESSIACAGDSSASGSGTSLAVGALTAGQQATCTITNKRKPQVKVVKALVPAADPGKFNLQVNAVTKKTDAGDTDNTGFVNVAVGSNPTVGELAGTGTDLTDYESSIACAGDSSASGSGTSLAVGALTAGQQATCTITNKRKPQVKVVKALVPAADPGKFNLQVNAVTKKTDAGDTDNTGFVNVAVGSNPTVGELAGTGTDLTDYESSIACAGDSSASGSGTSLAVGALTAGQQATCTITNKRKPQVKVVKALVPAADPGKFNLQVNAVTKKTDAGDTDNTGFVNVAVGSNPTVGELAGTAPTSPTTSPRSPARATASASGRRPASRWARSPPASRPPARSPTSASRR